LLCYCLFQYQYPASSHSIPLLLLPFLPLSHRFSRSNTSYLIVPTTCFMRVAPSAWLGESLIEIPVFFSILRQEIAVSVCNCLYQAILMEPWQDYYLFVLIMWSVVIKECYMASNSLWHQ
jgi:hypothetical protein